MTSVLLSSACACVSTRERGCAVVSGGCVSSTCVLLPYFSFSYGLQVSSPHYRLKWPLIMDEIHKCQEGTLLLITVAKAASISRAVLQESSIKSWLIDWPLTPHLCNPFIFQLLTTIAALSDLVDVFQKCCAPFKKLLLYHLL